MAQTSYPDPALGTPPGALTEYEWERVAVRMTDNGVYGDPTGQAAVIAGVGLNVTVKADRMGSVRGHNWWSGTTDYTHAISANASGQTRFDRVVLRLTRSDWTVRSVVKTGTPGSPKPILTQDTGDTGVFEIPLATVTVVDGAGSVTVAREELFVGSRTRPCTSATRPTIPSPMEISGETDTGKWVGWDGSTWRTIYEDTGTVNVNSSLSAWSIDDASVIQRRSGNVHLNLGAFRRQAGTLANENDSQLPVLIPTAYRHPTEDQRGVVFIGGAKIGIVTIYAANNTAGKAGQVWLTRHPGVTNDVDVIGSTISWVVG